MFNDFHDSVVGKVYQPTVNSLGIKPHIIARGFAYLYIILCIARLASLPTGILLIPFVLFSFCSIYMLISTKSEILFRQMMDIDNVLMMFLVFFCTLDFVNFFYTLKVQYIISGMMCFCLLSVAYLQRCYNPPPKKEEQFTNPITV